MRFMGRACGSNKHFVRESEAQLANMLEIEHNAGNEQALSAIPGGRSQLGKGGLSRNTKLGSLIFPESKLRRKREQQKKEGTDKGVAAHMTMLPKLPDSWVYTSPAVEKDSYRGVPEKMRRLYQDPRHDIYGPAGYVQVLRSFLRFDLFILLVLIVIRWGGVISEDVLLKMMYEKHKNLHSALYSLGVRPVSYLAHWVISGAVLHSNFILTVAGTMWASGALHYTPTRVVEKNPHAPFDYRRAAGYPDYGLPEKTFGAFSWVALFAIVIGALMFLLSMSVQGALLALLVGTSSNLEIDTSVKSKAQDKSSVQNVTRLRYINLLLLGFLLISWSNVYEEGKPWGALSHLLRFMRGVCFPQVAFWTLLSQAAGENFAGFRGACFSKPPGLGLPCSVRFGLDAEDAIPGFGALLLTLIAQASSLALYGGLLLYCERRWGNRVAGRKAVVAQIGHDEARRLEKKNKRRELAMRHAGLLQDAVNVSTDRCTDAGDAEPEADDDIQDTDERAVIADNLRIYYTEDKTGERVKAVDGVNLRLQPGEVFCLLGHNGAGKSTTISALSGLSEVSQGSVSIAGVEMSERTRLHCQQVTGICLQDDLLWDQMFVADHLELVARLRGLKNADNRALVEDSRLTNHLQKRTCELSGGWKRVLSCVS